jgi:hypothetical protein
MNPSLQKILFFSGVVGGVLATAALALATAIITRAKAA